MTEVYEVATFYHHFDVIKEGDTAPPAITVRVCDSIACDLAGSHDLLKALPGVLGQDVRVLHAPCVGRCETAPVAVVGQNPVPFATVQKVSALVKDGAVTHSTTDVAITPEDGDGRGVRGGDLLPPLRRGEGRRHRAAGDHGARVRFDRLRSRRLARSAREAAGAARHRRARAARAVRRPLRDGAGGRRRAEPDSARDGRADHGRRCAPDARLSRSATIRRRVVTPGHVDYAAYRAGGGYALAAACVGGREAARRRHRRDGGLGAARPGRRRLPRRPQVEAGVGRTGAAPDGDQHRRGRAGHVQGSLLPRARPAPLPRRRAHRGVGRRHRRRSTSTCATSTTAAARSSSGRSRRCRPTRRARCRRSTCAAAPAPTSAAKSRR